MIDIIFATKNKHKVVEINAILAGTGYRVITMEEAGIDIDVVEDGDSFEANALIKAKAIGELTDKVVLADDSGLEVDYLNKEPGIYSARYAGEETSYLIKNQLILDRVKEATGDARSARFVCAIAAAFPDGSDMVKRGTIEGLIADEPKGSNGFGYDPIFYVPEYEMTSAELSEEMKNKISHRGKALVKMIEPLNRYFGQ